MTFRYCAAAMLLAGMSFCANQALAQQTINFSYAQTDQTEFWGTGKAEAYDIAIQVKESALVGTKITSISIPVFGDADIINTSVWMSQTLALDGKVNVPDLMSADVAFPEGEGVVEYTLDEPYTITEDGVYVGYSFTVNAMTDENDAMPVVVTQGVNPNGFWIHTKRTYSRWMNKSESLGLISPITVKIEGDFHANEAVIYSVGTAISGQNKEVELEATIVNNGTEPISTIGYTLTVGDQEQSGEYAFETPVNNIMGTKAVFPVVFPKMPEGKYEYTLVLDKVNGEANAASDNSYEGLYSVYKVLPVNRPLMEEFTGTWCGYCVRGWMAMELMHEAHPETFMAIAYHNGDPMQIPNVNPFIKAYASGFPQCVMNRTVSGDPYYGTGESNMGINDLFNSMASEFNSCAVVAKAGWADAAKTTINTYANVTFVEEPEGSEYTVEFVLVGNNITGDGTGSWLQSNYYVGEAGAPEEMAPFVSGEYAKGSVAIPFNDVALLTTGFKGIKGSLDGLVANEMKQVGYTFNLADIVNSSDEAIPYDADKLQVVAIVLDMSKGGYGKVVNSARADVEGTVGVGNVTVESVKAVESITYYDLSGRQVANPANGIYIKSVKFVDGSRLNTKIAR